MTCSSGRLPREGTPPGCRVATRHGEKLFWEISRTRRRNGRRHHLPRADAGELVRRARHHRHCRGGLHRPGQVQLQQDADGRRADRRDVVARRPGLRHLRDHGGGAPRFAFELLAGSRPAGAASFSIEPKSASEAGNNATLGKFADGYTGLTLTNTKLKYPSTKATEYTNGEKCPAGTPDAGKVGIVQARSWVISTTTSKNHEEEETGGATTDQARGSQVRQSPTDHDRLRAQGDGDAQAALLDHSRPAAGAGRRCGAGGHDDHDGRRHDDDARRQSATTTTATTRRPRPRRSLRPRRRPSNEGSCPRWGRGDEASSSDALGPQADASRSSACP